ncbi:MAG: hypothetical protein HY903_01800 [Deltaproteobacteria bacterium]|nr:hypothetical protein [Deltaproteobacteria bacterium]
MRNYSIVFGYCLAVALLGCGGGSAVDGGQDRGPTLTTGKSFSVSGEAALTCDLSCGGEQDQALSYQTPSGLQIGVTAVELLRSATDPSPHRLLAATPAKEVDLVAGATFAAVDIGSIPEGTYTHMQVSVAWVRFDAAATAHANDMTIPGTLTVDYAVSSYADPAQGPRSAGDYLASFCAFGSTLAQAGSHPVEFPPPYPGATVDASAGTYRVRFAMADGPVTIDHGSPTSVDAAVTFYIEDALGWRDLSVPGYTTGVLDLAPDAAASEQPESMAIRGFSVSVVEDEALTP